MKQADYWIQDRKPQSAEHQSSTGHIIDWGSVSVLNQESNILKRKTKVVVNIRKDTPKLNRNSGWEL